MVPCIGTSRAYLCKRFSEIGMKSFKKEVTMWFAVIVFVSLSVEVLSHLTGGEINLGTKEGSK